MSRVSLKQSRKTKLRRKQQKEVIERSVEQYYGSLSSKEAHEKAEWGTFALREFLAMIAD